MELLYIWIKNYKNIKRQGFNISSKFNFEYDEKKNEITISKNENHIENFFGENILDVTALVGENGSGKSTLCHFITAIPETSLIHISGEYNIENGKFKKIVCSYKGMEKPKIIPKGLTGIEINTS
jgi:ABC-type polysaccharide/polyol phosphate transport system ATPase subunit